MGVENVGGGGVALFANGGGQLGRFAPPNVKLDARVLRKLGVEWLDELLLATRLDDEFAVFVRPAAGAENQRGETEERDQQGELSSGHGVIVPFLTKKNLHKGALRRRTEPH